MSQATIALLWLLLSFIPALPLMFVGEGVLALKDPVLGLLANAGCPGIVLDLIGTVIFQSFSYISKMLGFVFGVTLVFGLLEEVGVMARISYVFDNSMGKLGLQGKSVMPFLVSFGCTMGGAAGSRVIDNWGTKGSYHRTCLGSSLRRSLVSSPYAVCSFLRTWSGAGYCSDSFHHDPSYVYNSQDIRKKAG